ncbi:gluconate 2-dehydrogenase subunit 3 family protein [Sphingomonas flavalba]|uniref:gluconate 2-dehydrogenase subunit 3 family protein n=1 Tax=Sphingomonas flavalba TaxID=2559804 RepID=UPI0039E05E47
MAEDILPSGTGGLLGAAVDRRALIRGAGGALGGVWLSALGAGPLAADAGLAPLFRRLGEIVIPTTDTPGAGTEELFAFLSRAAEAGLFGVPADLLGRLRRDVDARAGGDFLRLPAAAQAALVVALDAESYAPGSRGDAPWCMVKTLILVGYYTSEAGASEELDYQPVPGRYDPDVPTGAGYRAQSTDWSGLSIRKDVARP